MANDANNMVDYFKKKLLLIIDTNELKTLKGEFYKEKTKYF